MRPGRKDIKIEVLIAGEELKALKERTWAMCEAYGLDRRIERYQGKRPIGLYSWDMDCLLDVIFFAIRDEPDKESANCRALASLHARLKSLDAATWRV